MLDDLFPGSSQVMLLGLPGETPDEAIWNLAKEHNYTIVTADADFARLTERFGGPLKVIRLERMDYSTSIASTLIRHHAIAIAEFEKSEKEVLLLRRL